MSLQLRESFIFKWVSTGKTSSGRSHFSFFQKLFFPPLHKQNRDILWGCITFWQEKTILNCSQNTILKFAHNYKGADSNGQAVIVKTRNKAPQNTLNQRTPLENKYIQTNAKPNFQVKSLKYTSVYIYFDRRFVESLTLIWRKRAYQSWIQALPRNTPVHAVETPILCTRSVSE